MGLRWARAQGTRLRARIPAEPALAILAFTIFAAVLAYVMAPMATAGFGFVDDHEIVAILGPTHHVGVTDLPAKIAQWAIDGNGRFRPGYYTLRVLEATAVGANPQIWYLDRYLLGLVAAGALLGLAYGYVKRLPLLVLPLMLLAGPQAEIWTRLGPQESYAVPIVLVGLAMIRWRHQTAGLILLMAAGLVKESFILLLPAVIAWLAWRQGRNAWKTILVVGIVGILEGSGVLVEIARYGAPYAQTRTLGSAVDAARYLLVQFGRQSGWYLAVLLGLAAAIPLQSRPRVRTALIVGGAAFVLVFLPQAFFYGGQPADYEGRYFFPALFFAMLVVILGLWTVEGAPGSRTLMAASIVVALVCGLLMAPQVRTAHVTADAASANSRSFQAGISSVEVLLERSPSSWVVLRPAASTSYEADIAVQEFLMNSNSIPRGIAIEAPPLAAGSSPGDQRLHAWLVQLATNGGSGFQALGNDPSPATCIEVDFSQTLANARCSQVVTILGL